MAKKDYLNKDGLSYFLGKITVLLSKKSDTGHTHKTSEISDLTVTATELNYMDGVTSNVQTQLDVKSNSNHNHDTAYDALGSASNALKEAKDYTDDQLSGVVYAEVITSSTLYSITNTYTGDVSYIFEGESYVDSVSIGMAIYSATVTMGGIDASGCYDCDGMAVNINIPSVTGDIVITIEAND